MNTDNRASTTPEQNSELAKSKQSRLVSKVLSPAVRLWLRSQVQQVSSLEVKVSGSDRQLLTGHIPCVSVSASHAVYQGLHLSQIQLMAEGIRFNLGAVLRGQPLQLMEPVPVFSKLLLRESDLNASLPAAILVDGLTEFLVILLQSRCLLDPSTLWITNRQFSWQNPQVKLDAGKVVINATLLPTIGNPTPIVISTGLQLGSSHELQLNNPEIQIPLGSSLTDLNGFKLDLGPEVALEELTLIPGQVICRGRINVIPTN